MSEGGAFLASPRPYEKGTVLFLGLRVQGPGDVIRTTARVVYEDTGPETGMGMVFVDLSDEDQRKLSHHVDLLRRLVRN